MSDRPGAVDRPGAPSVKTWAWWAAVALACIVPALPLLLTEVPPLSDYPNHLARMWFLGTQTRDPAMAAMLAPAWGLLPNLGVDAVLPWVMRVVPVHVAGRAMLAVILMLPVLGAVALSTATFGRRSFWALGAALVTCHALFLLGFLNFGLSVGLSMLAGAAWFRFRERWPVATVAGAVVAACLLFFCHLMGVAFFLLLVGACEAERCWAERSVLRRAAAVAVVVAAPAALYVSTALHGTGGPTIFASWGVKGRFAIYPVLNYALWLDVATAVLIAGVVIAGVATGRLLVPLRWRVVLGVLLVLFAVAPVTVKGLSYVDARFSVLLALGLFAGLQPIRVPRRMAALVGAGALALLLGRTALVGSLWHEYDAEVTDVRAVIAGIEPGARVLPVWGEPAAPGLSGRLMADGTMVDWHLPAVVMIDRRAFWPYMFADPGQQPVRWLGDYATLARDTPGLVRPRMLSGVQPPDAAEFPLWQTWQARYDYVLLIEIGGPRTGAMGAGWLEPLAHRGMATLFRVRGHPQG